MDTGPTITIQHSTLKDTRGDDGAEAIKKAQSGDSDAFGLLFKAHYNQVFRTVHGMMGNEADAQDVTQQAWLKAWQKIHHFNFKSSFNTWIHRIAVNSALDELRRRKRTWSRFISIFKDNEGHSETFTHEPATAHTPSDDLLKDESAQSIHQAIAKLPEAQRTVLVLKEFEDYTYQQIADTLGCKIGTVMSRLHLARKKLHSDLNQAKK